MTQPFHIIGLTGPKGSGKDTVAQLLRTHAGFYVCAFADRLRQEVCEAFREEPILFNRRETKEHPLSALALRRCSDDAFLLRMIDVLQERGKPVDLLAPRSPREIMQWWGTEYRRRNDPHYWTNALQNRISRLLISGESSKIVVTDVRFDNEARVIRLPDFGGTIWQVTRPGCGVPARSHVSEVDGSQFAPDYCISNSSDIRTLQEQVLGKWWAMDAGLESVIVSIAA